MRRVPHTELPIDRIWSPKKNPLGKRSTLYSALGLPLRLSYRHHKVWESDKDWKKGKLKRKVMLTVRGLRAREEWWQGSAWTLAWIRTTDHSLHFPRLLYPPSQSVRPDRLSISHSLSRLSDCAISSAKWFDFAVKDELIWRTGLAIVCCSCTAVELRNTGIRLLGSHTHSHRSECVCVKWIDDYPHFELRSAVCCVLPRQEQWIWISDSFP